jgi:ppGpp synthetase/RelA/SpoT-type nucleotidyltranferase
MELTSQLYIEFGEGFDAATALAEKHMKEMLETLPQALTNAGVSFNAPMPHRIKTLSSAHGALARRQRARMERHDLKRRLEAASPEDPDAWATYWKRCNKPERIHDVGPFHECKELFANLHDLAGFRILLYFPGEVENVINVLQEHEGIEVVRILDRGGNIAPDMVKLKEYVNGLERKTMLEMATNDKIFSGYRATHIIVRPQGKLTPFVEIQVATVVMNAWAQVEHDIIYKPSEDGYSREVMQILDTFNGMVMLGENALRQLETTIDRETKSRDLELQTTAKDEWDLAKWIRDYYIKKRPDAPSPASSRRYFENLTFLFRVLQIKGDQSQRLVNSLVHGVLEEDPKATFSDIFPLKLITQSFGEVRHETPNFGTQTERREARFLARRVVESFNIAIYLDILYPFISIFRGSFQEDTPTLIDFLDILHPRNPKVHGNHDDLITRFCQKFLDQKGFRKRLGDATDLSSHERVLIETSLTLALSDIGAAPKDDQDEDATLRRESQHLVVPRGLCILLSDPNDCHWVPELCSVAQFLTNVQSESHVPLHHMLYQADLHDEAPLMIKSLSEEHERRAEDANLFVAMKPQRLEFKRGKSNAWWEIVLLQGGRVLHEYHADKSSHANQTGHSRKHPGLFRSFHTPAATNRKIPSWSYHEKMPENWQLYSLDRHMEFVDIRREDQRVDELVDFGSSLDQVESLKFSERTQDGGLLYELNVGGKEFHLKSRQSDYVLHRKDYHDFHQGTGALM